MPSPFYTEAQDEIFVSRLANEAPHYVRMSINPLSGGKAVYIDADTAEEMGRLLIELARDARA